MGKQEAYIAGIGTSDLSTQGSDPTVDGLAIVAGTRALLDAGITYSDVDQSVASFTDDLRISRSAIDTFGLTGAPVSQVDNHSGLFAETQYIKSGQANVVLVLSLDKEAQGSGSHGQFLGVGVVLVSKAFLTSHAYLKDAAVCIRGSSLVDRVYSRSQGEVNAPRTSKTAVQAALRQAGLEPKDMQLVEILSDFSVAQPRISAKSLESFVGSTGMAGLAGLVWQLRGWTNDRPVSQARNVLQYTAGPAGAASVAVLCRSDGKTAPSWAAIEHLRDGRERLGYNPAAESKKLAQEDLESVKAREEFTLERPQLQIELPVKGGDRAALARL